MTRIVRWSAIAVIVTAMFASLYLVMQQIERQGADDAPGRLASQLASQLSSSGSGADASAADDVDLAASDATFFVIYDSADRPVSGTGRIDGGLAAIPAGVLDQARRTGTNHVTWQIADGRRFATVEHRAGDTVVLGGQSLAPTEGRIDQLGLLILVAWACVLAIVAVGFLAERVTAGASEPGRTASARAPRGA
jgi:hypothetical protein